MLVLMCRRSSTGSSASASKSASMEYLWQTTNSNFRARSNPIGLAEPKVKRDGYASAAANSFYASSEYVETSSASSSSFRRASTSSLTGVGIRSGGGLIATGKPSNTHQFCMPFGGTDISQTSTAKSRCWRKSSQRRATSVSTEHLAQNGIASQSTKTLVKTESSTSKEVVSLVIRKGIKEMESLTRAAENGHSNSQEDQEETEETEESLPSPRKNAVTLDTPFKVNFVL
jgi:hypothetical protein